MKIFPLVSFVFIILSIAFQETESQTDSKLASIVGLALSTFTVQDDPIIGQKIGVRVNGIDTPEIKGKFEPEEYNANQG